MNVLQESDTISLFCSSVYAGRINQSPRIKPTLINGGDTIPKAVEELT
jgi:hypothetical protein